MVDTICVCVDAKTLSNGAVRHFYETLTRSTPSTKSLPDDDESFNGEGVALVSGTEVLGLYLYKAFVSIQTDKTLYYPYGGLLPDTRHTKHHQSLVENLIHQLKSDSNVQIIVSLDQQPMQQSEALAEDEAFWLVQGFSYLDMQVFYQGVVKHNETQVKLDFSVSEYAGGDHAINIELCHLYRKAYDRRAGIPDVTPESIDEQLAIPSCSYLIMRHNDALIGQVTLFISQKECYVDSIYVKRSYWGTGAADTLTQSLFDFAKAKGCQTVSGTAASNNRASCALMERFGLVAQHQVKRMTLSL